MEGGWRAGGEGEGACGCEGRGWRKELAVEPGRGGAGRQGRRPRPRCRPPAAPCRRPHLKIVRRGRRGRAAGAARKHEVCALRVPVAQRAVAAGAAAAAAFAAAQRSVDGGRRLPQLPPRAADLCEFLLPRLEVPIGSVLPQAWEGLGVAHKVCVRLRPPLKLCACPGLHTAPRGCHHRCLRRRAPSGTSSSHHAAWKDASHSSATLTSCRGGRTERRWYEAPGGRASVPTMPARAGAAVFLFPPTLQPTARPASAPSKTPAHLQIVAVGLFWEGRPQV
jgi:hypothetical protein